MRSLPKEQTQCPTCGAKYSFANCAFKDRNGKWMCMRCGIAAGY